MGSFGYMEISTQANCYFFDVWKFPYRQTAIGYIYNFGRMKISIQANCYWGATSTLGTWKFSHRQTAIFLACGNFHTGKLLLGTSTILGAWKFPYRLTAILKKFLWRVEISIQANCYWAHLLIGGLEISIPAMAHFISGQIGELEISIHAMQWPYLWIDMQRQTRKTCKRNKHLKNAKYLMFFWILKCGVIGWCSVQACSAIADLSNEQLWHASLCSLILVPSLLMVSPTYTFPHVQGISYTMPECLSMGNWYLTFVSLETVT